MNKLSETEIIKTMQELKEIYSSPDPFKDDEEYDRAIAIERFIRFI